MNYIRLYVLGIAHFVLSLTDNEWIWIPHIPILDNNNYRTKMHPVCPLGSRLNISSRLDQLKANYNKHYPSELFKFPKKIKPTT